MSYPTASARAQRNTTATTEKVESLTGQRGASAGKAVTLGDAASLGAIAIRCTHVSAAPTAADFNALVDDVRALAAVLNNMGARFTGL